MAITVVVHVVGAESIVAEIDKLPEPETAFLTLSNIRKRDGKPVDYIDRDAAKVIFPWHYLNFVEIMPGEEDQMEVESFFRD